jgi:midasin (ATPase involved in ribosome maturation)
MARRRVDKPSFLKALRHELGEVETVNRNDIARVCVKNNQDFPFWFVNPLKYRDGRGIYSVKRLEKDLNTTTMQHENRTSAVALQAPMRGSSPIFSDSLVPKRAKGYVPFGHHQFVKTIIGSGKFYAVYITGLSGNGKTFMVEQVCAELEREMIRANITIETDEDDLLGGFRLVDGHTEWQDGPAVIAAERGAVLLLDECDLGSNKLLCLQPVLEGRPFYLKKVNRWVTPKAGFTIAATANTKGKGSEDGRYIGTNVMNDAFLERFAVTMEQEYPDRKIEIKILNKVLEMNNTPDEDFVEKLTHWADINRKMFNEGQFQEVISTRRLVHICNAFSMFKDRLVAVQMCLARFDKDTQASLVSHYNKVDSNTMEMPEEEEAIVDVVDQLSKKKIQF